MDKKSGLILAAACGKGREHDCRRFKRSAWRVCPDRRKTIALSPEQRVFNRLLASQRVIVENVIRRLKIFRVLKETYRHRRRRHGLRVHLLAGLYNHDLHAES